MELINWRLASHPLNWLTLFLMVFIVSLAAHLILSKFTTPAKSDES